ncbi:MAG: PEP-CTERM sorting domain-containing protein, partial [Phycisphaerae bacterium]
KPSSIRPMDSSHSSNMERKESFMFSNRSQVLRGCSLAVAALAAVACVGLANTASASTITWGAAANISGDTDVSTAGSLVVANEFGSSTTPETVNGVTFSPFTASPSAVAKQGAVTLSAPTSGDTVETMDVGFGPSGFSASYNALLNGAAALGNGPTATNGLDPMDLTITGLTSGAQYQIEIWVNDSRGYPVSRQETLSGSSSDSAVISYLMSPPGQFITGTFTADNTGSQTVSMTPVDNSYGSNNADAQINAFQLRVVPEPATLALVAVGGLGLLLLKRRKTV